MSFYKGHKIVCLRKFSSLGHCSVNFVFVYGRSCLYKDNDFLDCNLNFAFAFGFLIGIENTEIQLASYCCP